MQTFPDWPDWLDSKNIDANELEPTMKAALAAQFTNELLKLKPPATLIVIPDDTPEERWSRAIRLEVQL